MASFERRQIPFEERFDRAARRARKAQGAAFGVDAAEDWKRSSPKTASADEAGARWPMWRRRWHFVVCRRRISARVSSVATASEVGRRARQGRCSAAKVDERV